MSFFQENGFRVSTNHVAEFRAICRVAVWWKCDTRVAFWWNHDTLPVFVAPAIEEELGNNRDRRASEAVKRRFLPGRLSRSATGNPLSTGGVRIRGELDRLAGCSIGPNCREVLHGRLYPSGVSRDGIDSVHERGGNR
jgi:hypothetical protein